MFHYYVSKFYVQSYLALLGSMMLSVKSDIDESIGAS